MSVSFKKEQIGERISVSAAIFFRLGINSLAFEVIDTRAWCSLSLAQQSIRPLFLCAFRFKFEVLFL